MLAACLLALRDGEEGVDAQVGALVLAETVLLVRAALKQRR